MTLPPIPHDPADDIKGIILRQEIAAYINTRFQLQTRYEVGLELRKLRDPAHPDPRAEQTLKEIEDGLAECKVALDFLYGKLLKIPPPGDEAAAL